MITCGTLCPLVISSMGLKNKTPLPKSPTKLTHHSHLEPKLTKPNWNKKKRRRRRSSSYKCFPLYTLSTIVVFFLNKK